MPINIFIPALPLAETPFWAAWDFWVAAFTLLLWLATIWLAIEARRALDHDRRSSEQQLRAYMLIDTITLRDGTNFSPPITDAVNRSCVSNELKNYGQTPAHGVIHVSRIDVRPSLDETVLQIPELDGSSSSTLGPGAKISKDVWCGRTFLDGELQKIRSRELCIFIHGTASYLDVFGKKQSCEYKAKYTGLYPPSGPVSMTYCDTGNTST